MRKSSIERSFDESPASRQARSIAKTWQRALAASSSLGEHSCETLPALIDQVAERDGNALALISDTINLTYGELIEESNRYARWALGEGLEVGDVVCLMMPNKPEYIAFWLGLTRIGVVVALLNTSLRGASLAHCMNGIKAKHVVVDTSLMPAYESAKSRLSTRCEIWCHGPTPTSAPRVDTVAGCLSGTSLRKSERRSVTLSHRALQIFTSGTTGQSKAANVSHYRVKMWSCWFAGMLDVKSSDRMYDCLPMFHSIGGIVAIGALLARGGSIVVRERFSVSSFWRDVVETKCTLFFYIGELCRYLLNDSEAADARGHSLRLCCGNGLRADVWTAFQDRFRIPSFLEFYASTEGNVSLYNVEGRVGSIGRVPPFLKQRFPVALIDFDRDDGHPMRDWRGRCREVGANEIGEAIGRIGGGKSSLLGRFEGYESEEETENKILRDVFDVGDSWFRSGDLMCRDRQGFYYFVDRIGDNFRWKGENIAASEVAETLASCDGIREANVYGVKVGRTEGRAGMAALVIEKGFDLSGMRRRLLTALPRYAHPVFVRIRPEMDVTETFKLKKGRLVDESFDPNQTTDVIYLNDPDQDKYVRLTPLVYEKIESGQLRL